jgi:rRNA methylases
MPVLAQKGVLAKPTAWLFGNEAHGLGDKALAQADQVVSIPQYGPVESMNLATAASVCVFQSAFAQHPDGLPESEADS